MTKCPALDKDGAYKTFGEVTQKLIDLIGIYTDCVVRHNNLVDFEGGK